MKKITDRMLLGGGVVEDPNTLVERGRQYRRPDDLRLRRSLRVAHAKFRRQVPGRVRGEGCQADAPADAAGIHARELIKDRDGEMETVPLAHDPGWERTGAKGTI